MQRIKKKGYRKKVKDVESAHVKKKVNWGLKKSYRTQRIKKKVIEKKVKDVESAKVTNMI